MNTPWAVLKCKFSDNDIEPFSDDFYDRLFTNRGAGSSNMNDFFSSVSHGSLDLSESRVFGWFTLPHKRSDYRGQPDRLALVEWARDAAKKDGVDLEPFFGVIVTVNVPTDLFGVLNRRAAVCDSLSLMPSYLGQEMGHGYGLDHSRADGSDDDYRDRWDAMSTLNGCFTASHPEYGLVGPGLNAANMRSQGWLDESRVWRSSLARYDEVVELRPLHSHGEAGWLAADVGADHLIEFRTVGDWDAGLPRSAVFGHRLSANHSYILATAVGAQEAGAGDSFVLPDLTSVDVVNIDTERNVATIRIRRRLKPIWRRFVERVVHILVTSGLGGIIGSAAVDGPGLLIANGRIIPIPPWSPIAPLLREAAGYLLADGIHDPRLRISTRTSASERIRAKVDDLVPINAIRVPAHQNQARRESAP
jgi:hypothetical protein